MNTTFRTTGLDMARRGAAVLLAAALVALAADVYSQPGTRQSASDIDKDAAVEAHQPRIAALYQSNVTSSVVNTFNPNRVPFIEKE